MSSLEEQVRIRKIGSICEIDGCSKRRRRTYNSETRLCAKHEDEYMDWANENDRMHRCTRCGIYYWQLITSPFCELCCEECTVTDDFGSTKWVSVYYAPILWKPGTPIGAVLREDAKKAQEEDAEMIVTDEQPILSSC